MKGVTRESVKEYIDKLYIEGKSSLTIKNYLSTLNRFIKFYLSHSYEPEQAVMHFFANLRKDCSNNSLLRHYATLKMFFKFLNREIPELKIKRTNYIRQEISLNELKKLLHSKNLILKLLILLLSHTGLRISEVKTIRAKDLLQDEFNITGKGNKIRTILIPKNIKNKLIRILNKLSLQQEDYVFNYTTTYLEELLRKHSLKILGRKVTPHDLRHYFATYCLNKGLDVYSLSKLLGHSNIQTTQIYAKMNMNTIRKKFAKIFK